MLPKKMVTERLFGLWNSEAREGGVGGERWIRSENQCWKNWRPLEIGRRLFYVTWLRSMMLCQYHSFPVHFTPCFMKFKWEFPLQPYFACQWCELTEKKNPSGAKLWRPKLLFNNDSVCVITYSVHSSRIAAMIRMMVSLRVANVGATRLNFACSQLRIFLTRFTNSAFCCDYSFSFEFFCEFVQLKRTTYAHASARAVCNPFYIAIMRPHGKTIKVQQNQPISSIVLKRQKIFHVCVLIMRNDGEWYSD